MAAVKEYFYNSNIPEKDSSMTSELLNCPFCGCKEHLIIDDYHDPEMKGYFGFNVICNAAGWDGAEKGCGAAGAWGETKEEAVKIWNTRAVPDVPELVRYDLACDFDGKYAAHIVEVELGEYVLYSQAAAIITAERQRAEAAEAKLASYEKQEPVAWQYAVTYPDGVKYIGVLSKTPMSQARPLYASPAPMENNQ